MSICTSRNSTKKSSSRAGTTRRITCRASRRIRNALLVFAPKLVMVVVVVNVVIVVVTRVVVTRVIRVIGSWSAFSSKEKEEFSDDDDDDEDGEAEEEAEEEEEEEQEEEVSRMGADVSCSWESYICPGYPRCENFDCDYCMEEEEEEEKAEEDEEEDEEEEQEQAEEVDVSRMNMLLERLERKMMQKNTSPT